jgi:anti-anti-sigma factor
MPDDTPIAVHFEFDGGMLDCEVRTSSLMGDDAQGLGDAIMDEMHQCGEELKMIAVDLSQVSTINSVTLGVLVTVQTEVMRRGVQFCLLGVHPRIQELLNATRLATVFQLFDDRAALQQSLHGE